MAEYSEKKHDKPSFAVSCAVIVLKKRILYAHDFFYIGWQRSFDRENLSCHRVIKRQLSAVKICSYIVNYAKIFVNIALLT